MSNIVRVLEELELKQEIKFAAEELEYLLLEYMERFGVKNYDRKLFDALFTPLVEIQIDEIF